MELTEQQIKAFLQRISNILLVNGGFMDNPGLYTGDMGLAVFLFRYADFTQNEVLYGYGYDLIDKVQEKISSQFSVFSSQKSNELHLDYRNGLTGIGSAFEYLVQYGYIEADTDDILAEFDERIFSIADFPLLSIEDLFGVGYYALWRMKGESKLKRKILKTVLPPLVRAMEEKCKHLESPCSTVWVLQELIENENFLALNVQAALPITLRLCRFCYPYGIAEETYNRFAEQLSQSDFSNQKGFELGLQNGLAGFGMALMNETDGDGSWVYLLHTDLKSIKNSK